MKVSWVASFPKSGNTWMRFILAHLLFGIGDDHDVITEMIPDMHYWARELTYKWNDSFLIKTHYPYDALPSRIEFDRAVYIVRHPFDVVVSSIQYMEPEGAPEQQLRVAQDFLAHGNLVHWRELGFGSWEDNVSSWTQAAEKKKVLVLRYEDILEDPTSSILSVATFFDTEVSHDRATEIADATSFDSLKKLESAEVESGKGFFVTEKKYKENRFVFMKEGRANRYQDILPDSLQSELYARFKVMMGVYGYTV